jgi:choline dehydrogenase-like flavoprotein
MILDAASADRTAFARPFDACIIGSGPAGITIARRLAAAGANVALMEAGGLEYTELAQDPYKGEVVGLDYFPIDFPRLRYFGGTSNHWAGWCRTLDPYDFAPKLWNPWSGWPIGALDLDPYRAETDSILDIPSATEVTDLPMPGGGYDFRRIQFRWSPPTRFAEKYGPEIEASDRIHLVLNANLVDLRLTDDGAAVTGAVFLSYAPDDPGFTVAARTYCLCTGGIENARLLLNFRSQSPEGIGNRHDLVGRFFAEHPHFVLADVLLPAEPLAEMEFYAPTEEFIHAQEIQNLGLRLEPGPWPPTLIAALARNAPAETPFILSLVQHLTGAPPDEIRRAVAAENMPVVPTARIRTAHEQALNRDSRVRLGDATDAFGLQRTVLDWRLTELDTHTMRTAATEFGRHLAETNRGRARLRDWLLAEPADIPGTDEDEVGGKHHLGTTRMADDPRNGVVDSDCRVHGLDNLWIGGSSVFATPGHANPTYTIVQLALRLGDHLQTVLATGQ